MAILEKKDHPGKGPLGIFAQLNNAVQYIKNDWVTYASSNDVALSKKLYDEINKCILNNKKVCYSSYYTTNYNLKITNTISFRNFNYPFLLYHCYITDCSIVEANVFKEMMPFDLKYENAAYWDLWIRIYHKFGNIFVYNNKPEFLYRISNKSQHIIREKNIISKKRNDSFKLLLLNKYRNLYFKQLSDYRKSGKITEIQYKTLIFKTYEYRRK